MSFEGDNIGAHCTVTHIQKTSMKPSAPSIGSGYLTSVLRESLRDVLMDTSLESYFGTSVTPPLDNSLLQNGMEILRPIPALPGVEVSSGVKVPGTIVPSRSIVPNASSDLALSTRTLIPPVRPSMMLGITSNELLIAAAAERRMLADAIREQTVVQKIPHQGLHNHSLQSLFQYGFDGSTKEMKFGHPTPTQMKEEESRGTLETLGSSLRTKDSPYIDVSLLSEPKYSAKKPRGGVTEPFPEKLHRMLSEVEKGGKSDIVSFFSHGRAFGIHDPIRFIAEIMPNYFKQSHISSFQRQLNLYGFARITSGPDTGGYYHELFLKGRHDLCLHMRRVGVPAGADRRKFRAANMGKEQPDFYAMQSVTNHPKEA